MVAVTVRPLAEAIRRYAPPGARAIVAGGGARNHALLAALGAELSGTRIETSERLALDPDAKEAIAFAILGYETLRGRPANLPRVTGARGPTVLGSIVPHDLRSLLAETDAEIARARG